MVTNALTYGCQTPKYFANSSIHSESICQASNNNISWYSFSGYSIYFSSLIVDSFGNYATK